MKIVLIGAGSAQFGYGMLGDVFQTEALRGCEIALVDINGAALAEVHRNALDFVEAKGLDYRVTATTDRGQALPGADYVLISIEVGDRFALWDIDWKTPLQFGVRQVYGENGGPGGIFHALRITPPILAIVEDVTHHCPNAVVFNYSNPMTAITTSVNRRYPGFPFVGMCHEVASLERYLPAILRTPVENLRYRAAGLNHFSVLLEATYVDSGLDAYPEILKRAPAFFEKELAYSDVWDYVRRTGVVPDTEGATDRLALGRDESSRPWSDRGLFREILETYRLLPITVDSHLGEYISWAHDVADLRGILDFYDFYRFAMRERAWSEIKLRVQDRAVRVIEGLLGESDHEEHALNIANDGYLPFLPKDIAVEVPAVISRSGIRGVPFPDYPKGFAALLRSYAGVYDLTAEAILTGKKEYVLQAVLACPVVHTYRGMAEMVDTMIDEQREWVGYLT